LEKPLQAIIQEALATQVKQQEFVERTRAEGPFPVLADLSIKAGERLTETRILLEDAFLRAEGSATANTGAIHWLTSYVEQANSVPGILDNTMPVAHRGPALWKIIELSEGMLNQPDIKAIVLLPDYKPPRKFP
jgi:hypothetical protein